MNIKKTVRFQDQEYHERDNSPESISGLGHLTSSINSDASISTSSFRAAVAKEVTRLTKIPKDLFSLSSTQDRRWDSSVSPTTPSQARPSSEKKQTSSSSMLSDDLLHLVLGEMPSSSSPGASSSVGMNDKGSKSNRKNYSPPSIPLRKESTDSLLKAIVDRGKGWSSSSLSSSSSTSFPTATTPYNNIYNIKRNHSF